MITNITIQQQPTTKTTGILEVAAVAAPIIASGANAYSQGRTNRKTRKHNEHMYERQMIDNQTLWHQQNAYNHPKQQMQRLKEAGLNPNLVYGEGATATSRSQAEGGNTGNYNPEAPEIDPSAIGSSIGAIYDIRMKKEQTQNLAETRKNLQLQQDLTVAQTMATLKQAGYTEEQIRALQQEIEQKNKMNPISVQAAEVNIQKAQHEIKKTEADTAYTINQDIRAAAQNSASIQEAYERILRSQQERTKIPLEREKIAQEISNLKSNQKIVELDAALKAEGIQPGDPMYMRVLKHLQVQGFKAMDNVSEWLKDFMRKSSPLR